MLISDYATVDISVLHEHGASCPGNAELFLRDDRTGSVILCDRGEARRDGADKEVEILFSGGCYGKEGGDWLFLVGLWTPQEFRDEFLAWYRAEHLPILLECPTWDGCRFGEQRVAGGCQFYAVHQLSDKAALDSEARKRSRSTPWFKRLARNGWFDGAFMRALYERARG